MKQRGRRKMDCLVNGQSSVRIKNRIHLEGRGPEDGSPLLHVRGYEELCWSQLFHFRRNEFVKEVRERLRKREGERKRCFSVCRALTDFMQSGPGKRWSREQEGWRNSLLPFGFLFSFSKSILARILLVTSDKNKSSSSQKANYFTL